jgi:Arabinose efflux permease
MFTGLTLANVLGVPFGTFVGQEFGWRAAFWIVSAFGVLSLAGVTVLVPNRHDSGPVGLGHEVRVLKDPQVWTALAMTCSASAACSSCSPISRRFSSRSAVSRRVASR